MAGGEGLAERAGVVGIDGLVGHAFDTGISGLVDGSGFLQNLVDVFFLGIDFHLQLIEDTAEVLVQLGMEGDADMLQLEALFYCLFC